MALLLSLEASSEFCSVAIHHDGVLVSVQRIREPRAAAAKLAPAIHDIFEKSGIKLQELNGVAIASGPGSYTGLRIVSSTAKGICYALQIPLLAIDTLHVMTHAISDQEEYEFYCPVLDARRMEIYYQLRGADRQVIIPTTNLVVEKNSFQNELSSGRILFFGSGAKKTVDLINHPNAIEQAGIEPDAEQLGFLAFEKWRTGNFESLETFEPFYLKDFMVGRK